uniref:Uncharacterized protein n=1 Tax=Anguilla anguilla TaxID=7936 RepID=A0A0E9PUA3_ANGAN
MEAASGTRDRRREGLFRARTHCSHASALASMCFKPSSANGTSRTIPPEPHAEPR